MTLGWMYDVAWWITPVAVSHIMAHMFICSKADVWMSLRYAHSFTLPAGWPYYVSHHKSLTHNLWQSLRLNLTNEFCWQWKTQKFGLLLQLGNTCQSFWDICHSVISFHSYNVFVPPFSFIHSRIQLRLLSNWIIWEIQWKLCTSCGCIFTRLYVMLLYQNI